MFNSKVFVAELIGTFALVFIGASSGIVSGGDLVAIALAHGLTIVVFVYAFGHISGTHINPAVTFGLALQGVVDWGTAAISYWIPQFLGAIGGAYLVRTFIAPLSVDAVTNIATFGALTAEFPYHAMGLEIILTFFFVNTILHTMVSGKGGQFSGLAIGLTLSAAILAGGPLTGASLNPARTFGPALFTGTWNDPMTYMIYFLGPLFGSTLAVVVDQFLNKSDEPMDEMEEMGDEMEPEPASKPAARKTSAPKTTARKTTKK
jgi:MIP family channel proteins